MVYVPPATGFPPGAMRVSGKGTMQWGTQITGKGEQNTNKRKLLYNIWRLRGLAIKRPNVRRWVQSRRIRRTTWSGR